MERLSDYTMVRLSDYSMVRLNDYAKNDYAIIFSMNINLMF